MRVLLMFFALLACAPVPLATRGADDPLVFDPVAVAQADRLAIFIPGALSSIDIFAATESWEDAGYARALYRYPGLDGLAVDHHVAPERVAARVADFANAHPDRPVALIGYSTGGPIAMMAATQITGDRPVRVAAMSTAVDFGGGPETLLRGARDVVRAALATGSVAREDVWKRFWSGLLYGPDALDDPARSDLLAQKIAEGEDIYVRLDTRMALAHALALPTWDVPDGIARKAVPTAFFIGLEDPVFAPRQSLRFARRSGDITVYGYPGEGHLLFFTRPDVFDDIRDFVEDRPVRTSGTTSLR